jgi:hypothetical protein
MKMKKLLTIYGIVIAMLVIGEIRCIYKALSCNWEPIGKAEVIYTGAALTGLGSIIGWINIEDK